MRQKTAIRPLSTNARRFRSVSSFGRALIAATVLHGIWVAHGLLTARTAPRSTTNARAAELQIEVATNALGLSASVTQLTASAEPALVQHEPMASRLAPGVRSPAAHVIASAAVQPDTQAVAGLANEAAPSDSIAAAPQPEPAATAVSKIDLGLNGGLVRMLSSQAPAKPPEAPVKQRVRRDANAVLAHDLTASILTDDVRRGRARGNVLLGPLNSAVREVGLTRGDAVIQVTVNSQGALSGIELLRGDARDWSAVLQAFRLRAKSKRVPIPSGAQGMRVTLNVSAKIQRTSGKEVESSAIGVNQPSLAPNGMTFGGDFDLTDLANKTNHMVYARVTAEELL